MVYFIFNVNEICWMWNVKHIEKFNHLKAPDLNLKNINVAGVPQKSQNRWVDNLDSKYNDSRSYPSASQGESTSKEEKVFAVQEEVELAGKEREMTLCVSKINREGAMLRRELQTTFYVITGKEEGNLGQLSPKWCQVLGPKLRHGLRSKLTLLCSLCSVASNSLRLHGLQPTRLLCPWDFPGKNTEVGCYFLLQGIFLTQGSNTHLLSLLYWLADSLPLLHLGNSNWVWNKY